MNITPQKTAITATAARSIKAAAGSTLVPAFLLPGSSVSMPLPDPDPVLRTISGGRSIYNDIVADSRVAALIDSRRGGLLARTITTEAGEAPESNGSVTDDKAAKRKANRAMTKEVEAKDTK